MTKYLFPGGNMPSIAQIGAAGEKSFVMEDWHLIGPDYDRTLIACLKTSTRTGIN